VAPVDVLEVVDVIGQGGRQLDGGGLFGGVEQFDLYPRCRAEASITTPCVALAMST
jgi:hypothetical protein